MNTKKGSFSKRLMIILSLLVIVPLIATSVILNISSYEYFGNTIKNDNLSIAEGIAVTVDTLLIDARNTMKVLAESSDVTSMNPREMDELLKLTVEHSSIISQIYVMNEKGKQIYKTSGELGDRSDRAYFQQAIKGEENFSDVLISGSTGQPIVVLAMPVENNGRTLGVIGASIDLGNLSALMGTFSDGKGSYPYIVENNGKTIAHPDSKYVEDMVDLSSLNVVEMAIQGKEGNDIYELDGVSKLASYTYIETSGWGVIMQSPVKVAYASIYNQIKFTLLLLAIFLVIGLFISRKLSRNIFNPISKINSYILRAADGDLTVNVDEEMLARNDEFGSLGLAFQHMIDEYRTLIANLKADMRHLNVSGSNLAEIADQNALAIEEVANDIISLAERAQEDMNVCNEVSIAMGRVSEGANSSVENAETISDILSLNAGVSNEGKVLMDKSAETIKATNNKSIEIDDKIQELKNSAQNIGNISDTIISIADQTNLLALNASIESARAGEAGKGFAVVAEEIRKLAEESNASANDISEIISMIQREVNGISELFKTILVELNDTVSVTIETSDKVQEISVSAEKARINVTEISRVSRDQAFSTVDINKNVGLLLETLNATADSTERISASVEEQTASTEQISSMVSEFKKISDTLLDLSDKFKVE